jgi:hypothetical protein
MKAFALALAIGALAIPAVAHGKGPTEGTMEGPGGATLSFAGDEGSGPLGELTERSGWFFAAFEQIPDPILPARPAGDLGPKYVATYTVPGPDNDVYAIVQDVYPYAPVGPVTYMEPGQALFEGMTTHGGWFQAGDELKRTLVAAGLPESPPSGSTDGSFPTLEVVGIALALAFAVAGVAVGLGRRRTRTAAPA